MISTQDYINNCYPNGFSANKTTSENWAAFMASQDADSFGIGLYSPEVTDFYYGVYPPKHSGASADNWHYRHAMTLDPATEVNTSYIAPIGVREFSSYTPTEYEFYISTGTVNDIRTSFGVLGGMECEHKNTHTEHKDSTCTEEGTASYYQFDDTSVFGGIFDAIFSIVISVYILAQKEKIGRFVKRFINAFINPSLYAVFLNSIINTRPTARVFVT